MRDILNYLDACALESEHYWTMWDCVEREEFDGAIYEQIQVLYYNDVINEFLASASQETLEFFETIYEITYGVKYESGI